MYGMIHSVDVYVSSGDTWVKFTPTPLRCRVAHNTLNTRLETVPTSQRAERLGSRRLLYPVDFDMPDNARAYWLDDPTSEGAVSRWNVLEATESNWPGINGRRVVNTCQLTRVNNVG